MNVIKNKLSNSPKEKSTKYETIFDLDLTEEELKDIVPEVTVLKMISKKDFISGLSRDAHYYIIYNFYMGKGDKKNAEKYYLMISEDARKKAEETEKNRVKDIIRAYD